MDETKRGGVESRDEYIRTYRSKIEPLIPDIKLFYREDGVKLSDQERDQMYSSCRDLDGIHDQMVFDIWGLDLRDLGFSEEDLEILRRFVNRSRSTRDGWEE
ncbi:MAG: hypothetical protein ABIJ23_04915 [Candidatus Magasanikbacteria bacterium]